MKDLSTSMRSLIRILQECDKFMNSSDIDDYAAPCLDCGLYKSMNLRIYLACDEDTAFGAGDFVIPVKPCGVIRLIVEQLAEANRLRFGGKVK